MTAADLRRALELGAKLPQPDTEARFERSRALALLAGLGTDAKSGVTAAEAKTFADQSVAALARVVKNGWALPSELKEPDFDALRGRARVQGTRRAEAARHAAGLPPESQGQPSPRPPTDPSQRPSRFSGSARPGRGMPHACEPRAGPSPDR